MTAKERIIENTLELLLARGCKSLTVDDISAENGISKRTLYELFTDKSMLLEACIERMNEKMKNSFLKFTEDNGNVLETLLKIHNFQSETMLKACDNFFDDVKKYYPEVYERKIKFMHKSHLNTTINMLLKGQDQGVFIRNLVNIDLVAKVISNFITSNVYNSPEIRRQYNRQEIFTNTVMLYIRGISTEKGVKLIDDYFNNQKQANN